MAETKPRAVSRVTSTAAHNLLDTSRVLPSEGDHRGGEHLTALLLLQPLDTGVPARVRGDPQAVQVGLDAVVEDGQIRQGVGRGDGDIPQQPEKSRLFDVLGDNRSDAGHADYLRQFMVVFDS